LRILQLATRVPWPANDGGRVAIVQITRGLAAHGCDVDLLTLNPAQQREDVGAARAALAPARVDAIDADISIARGMLRSLRTRAPLLLARFTTSAFARALRERLRSTRYDVVHIESPYLLSYLPLLRAESRAKIVMRAQNVEFHVWKARAEQARGVRRVVLRRVAASLREWELAHINACDALLPISRADAGEFLARGCRVPLHVLPCGVMVDAEPAPPGDPFAFYFVGAMEHAPNTGAARWLAEELWPRVVAREPRARLTIAGSRFPVALRDALAARGVTIAADVPDLDAFAAPFGAMLAPLFTASGMRVKTLEAMARGKPVIANTLGAGGIDLEPGVHALIANDVDTFAEAVLHCVREPESARRIGLAARALAAERYDVRRVTAELIDFYERLVRDSAR
jgi:glycosyltransferase involved in cell wall biosynthesis